MHNRFKLACELLLLWRMDMYWSFQVELFYVVWIVTSSTEHWDSILWKRLNRNYGRLLSSAYIANFAGWIAGLRGYLRGSCKILLWSCSSEQLLILLVLISVWSWSRLVRASLRSIGSWDWSFSLYLRHCLISNPSTVSLLRLSFHNIRLGSKVIKCQILSV